MRIGCKDFRGNRSEGWLSVQVLKAIGHTLPEMTASSVFGAHETTAGLATGLAPPLHWTTRILPGTRIFSGCQLAVQFKKNGTPRPITGTTFDARANEECATP